MDPEPDFDFCLFELFKHCRVELQMENPNLEFSVSRGVKCHFQLGRTHLFVLIVEKITLDCVSASFVFKERIYVIAALPNLLLSFIPTNNQSRRVLSHLNQENFIDIRTRRFLFCVNFGDLSQRYLCMDWLFRVIEDHFFHQDMDISNYLHLQSLFFILSNR